MADFRETLEISIYKDQFGNPSTIGRYCFCHSKEDLTDGTHQVLDFGDIESLGGCCKLIDDFENSSLKGRKFAIRAFLACNRYSHSIEY